MFNWLGEEISGFWRTLKLFVNLFLIGMVCNTLYSFIPIKLTEASNYSENVVSFLSGYSFVIVVGFLILDSLIEEFGFRVIPAVIGFALIEKLKIKKEIQFLVLMLVISSLIFGYIHGGYKTIITHSIFGILCSVCFLKCGGADKKIITALLFSSLFHFSWNLINYTFIITSQ